MSVHEEAETITLLDQCNTEIARLEALLDGQRRTRTRLQHQLIIIRSRENSSPFDRIPAETLQQIFEHAVADNSRDIGLIAMV